MIKILLILLGVVTAMLVTAYQSCGDIDFRIMVGIVTIWVGGLALLLTTVVGFFRTKEHGWHAWRPASWSLVSIAAIFFTLELSAQILH